MDFKINGIEFDEELSCTEVDLTLVALIYGNLVCKLHFLDLGRGDIYIFFNGNTKKRYFQ